MQKYLGIIGDPIEHSLSPVMHNTALKEQGLPYIYLPFRVTKENLKEALLGLRALNFIGINVTVPHKIDVIYYLDELSKEARLIGAVNVIKFDNGKMIGYNTDGPGFLMSLTKDGGCNPQGRRVLIIGAGGAARAVAVQLGLASAAQIVITNRTKERGKNLAIELSQKIKSTTYKAIDFTPETLKEEMEKADIIINATSVGMKSKEEKELLIKDEWIHPHHLVTDLVYNPLFTPLLKRAKNRGAKILTGDGMLLYQGVMAYEIWTGVKPPIDGMKKVLLNNLKNQ